MAFDYGTSHRARLFVWNAQTMEPVTGDAANITTRIAKDTGGWANTTNSATEDERGWYYVTLTATEMQAQLVYLIAETTTTNSRADFMPNTIETLSVDSTGHVGPNWGDLVNASTLNSLSNTSIKDVTDLIEVNVTQISGDSTAADELENAFRGQQSHAVEDASFTPVHQGDLTAFEALTNYAADGALVGQTIQFFDGANVGLTASIVQFLGTDTLGTTRNRYFVTRLPSLPSDTEQFIITSVNTAINADPFLLVSTNIATLSSQTSFTLDNGSSDDDAYNGAMVVVRDETDSSNIAVGFVSDYVGSTKTVTLREDPGIYTMAAEDFIKILAVPRFTSDNSLLNATSGVIDNVNTIDTAPTNWESLVISGGGAVDSLVQGFLNTAITETTAGNIADNFDTFYDNADALTTQTVDDVGGGGGGGIDWSDTDEASVNRVKGTMGRRTTIY